MGNGVEQAPLWKRRHVEGPGEKTYLKKVSCEPYIQGSRRSGGYLPKDGTIRLKSRATQTKRAGSKIWERNRELG